MSLFVGLLNVAVFVISVIASINLTNGCCKCCSSPSQINRGKYFVVVPANRTEIILFEMAYTISIS